MYLLLISRITKKISTTLRNIRSNIELVRKITISHRLVDLPDYPSSDSTPEQFISLTLKGAQSSYSVLHSFSNSDELMIIPLSEWPITPEEEFVSEKLRELFNRNGSDKGNSHGYHHVYATLLDLKLKRNQKILEIGIGTNNSDVPSNMGGGGIPGASLRSWRDLDPRLEIVGADIDSRILFKEERITTYRVDQTDQSSWQDFNTALGDECFDLIIDDGLHAPFANLLTIKNLLPKLTPCGYMVVEDVNLRSLPVWELFIQLTKSEIDVRVVQAKKAYMLILKNKIKP